MRSLCECGRAADSRRPCRIPVALASRCTDALVEFGASQEEARDDTADAALFVTGVGASSTYPDYKPAPFIVASKLDDVDMVTVVTEGIFSYYHSRSKSTRTTFSDPSRRTTVARARSSAM